MNIVQHCTAMLLSCSTDVETVLAKVVLLIREEELRGEDLLSLPHSLPIVPLSLCFSCGSAGSEDAAGITARSLPTAPRCDLGFSVGVGGPDWQQQWKHRRRGADPDPRRAVRRLSEGGGGRLLLHEGVPRQPLRRGQQTGHGAGHHDGPSSFSLSAVFLVHYSTVLCLSPQAIRSTYTTILLSFIATIFLPLTFLAGVFGMNFQTGASDHYIAVCHS